MRVLCTLIAVVFLVAGIFAQLGVKTHYPASGSLVNNATSGSSSMASSSGHYVYSTNGTLMFINRTLSSIPTGVCTKEVPTATLVKDASVVPAGNGSNPSMSRIEVCCEGFERNPHIFRKCDPVCKKECVNGLCVAPNVCRCFPDHVLNLGGFCIPTCPIGCGNGECQPDGSCRCSPGYTLEPMRKFCVPKCFPGCQNGNCTEPNVCQCNSGYERAADGSCAPKCGNCENGKCISPGICTCLPGYIKKGDICLPVCDRGCQNGFCVAPNVCSCQKGFILDKSGTSCTAHCDSPCLNGVCNGANKCTCNSGYIADEFNPFLCRPHCQGGCPNGVCSGPGFCLCNAGYVKDRSIKGRQVCVPSH